MPQLDAATYLSQITWLTIFFVTYYMVGLNYILPSLAGRLKARAKKVALSKARSSGFDGERTSALAGYDDVVSSSCGWVTRSLNEAVIKGDAWRAEQLRGVDSGALLNSNLKYTNSVSNVIAQGKLIPLLSSTSKVISAKQGVKAKGSAKK